MKKKILVGIIIASFCTQGTLYARGSALVGFVKMFGRMAKAKSFKSPKISHPKRIGHISKIK